MNRDEFRNPAHEFREMPFWSWNDRLDRDELVRQIRLMDEGGWGGFFMHSRLGLQTPYMGPAWLDSVRASVAEARARGMQAWLYDEDKWPSGYAGGLSIAANPAYRAKCLVCKVDDRPTLLAERIATFARTGGRRCAASVCARPIAPACDRRGQARPVLPVDDGPGQCHLQRFHLRGPAEC